MSQNDAGLIEQVRRYDLFKLGVAVLLFVAWLAAAGSDPVAPVSLVEPRPSEATTGSDMPWPAELTPLRIESTGNGIRLQGTVPDESTRAEYLAAARKALGRAHRVEDALEVAPGAARPDWLSHVGPALAALASVEGLTAIVDADHVFLEGTVDSDAHRTEIADAVTAAFGAPFTVVNRMAIAEPEPPPRAR